MGPPADAIRIQSKRADFRSELETVLAGYPRQVVDIGNRVGSVRLRLAVGGAIGTNQSAGRCYASIRALPNNSRVRDIARDADSDGGEIYTWNYRCDAVDSGQRFIETYFGFIDQRAAEVALKREDGVLRVQGDEKLASSDAFRRNPMALTPQHPRIQCVPLLYATVH